MIEFDLSAQVDFDRLGAIWRDLEGRSDPSFFQSWAWVGCLAPERYTRPLLLEARENGRPVALGLFNRASRRFGGLRLLLQESGAPEHDAVFTEHNGFLFERGRETGPLLGECLDHVLAYRTGRVWRRRVRRLVLSGVAADYSAAAASGPHRLRRLAERPAPYVDLLALRREGRSYLDSLSANTRYQLRRSWRRYAADGPVTVRRAATVGEALDFLDRLADWHQRYWTGRGRPGAFANAQFGRFHRALVETGVPAGSVDLLRIHAGEQAVGYLYNFNHRGRIYAYQSGFDYAVSDAHRKPGLTCHHAAIEMYAASGAERYDFLAGGDRYKTSLATAATTLHWLEMAPRGPFPRAAAAIAATAERRLLRLQTAAR